MPFWPTSRSSNRSSRPGYARSSASTSSFDHFFGNLGYGGHNNNNNSSSNNKQRKRSRSRSRSHSPSRSGFWGGSTGRSATSAAYSQRRRQQQHGGYIHRLVQKLRHLLRELYYYLRRNPVKVFSLVIMPLVSGGALAVVAGRLGIRLPPLLTKRGTNDMSESMRSLGIDGSGYYGSKGYGSSGKRNDGMGLGDNLGTLMNIAKLFI